MAFVTSTWITTNRDNVTQRICNRNAGGRSLRTRRAVKNLQMCSNSGSVAAHPDSLASTWPTFADKMRESGEIPELDEWHKLLDGCIRANDEPGSGIWLINLLRETGLKPTAVTYDKVLQICSKFNDKVAAFHLVEHMQKDKVLLGDVELPEGMEETLRKILPPDAFE